MRWSRQICQSHNRPYPAVKYPGLAPTPTAHKRTRAWDLSTEVRPSLLPDIGKGLFLCEKTKAKDHISRYYGELIDATEASRRVAAGSQYIVTTNSNQYIDVTTLKVYGPTTVGLPYTIG